MQPIVFNFAGSRFNREMEATALKAGYLLGDNPIIAGTTADEIYIRKAMADLSVPRKLECLIQMYRNQPEEHNAFVQMHQTYKKVAKLKYKEKELLVAHKQCEQLVNRCWGPALDHLEKVMDSYGFEVVRALQEEQVFYYLLTNNDPEDRTDRRIGVSDIMQRLLVVDGTPEDETDIPPEIFCLGNEFFLDEYAKPAIFSATDEEARNSDAVYLEHCFTLPHINNLTALELQRVRGQLSAPGSAFRKASDEWCNACYDEEEPAQRISLFINELLPAAKQLQPIIEGNEMLQLCRRQYSRYPEIEIWMGELPVHQLWEFYRHFNALQDKTWQILQNSKNDPAYGGQRWPIMVLKTKNNLLPDEPVEETKSNRKFISVD